MNIKNADRNFGFGIIIFAIISSVELLYFYFSTSVGVEYIILCLLWLIALIINLKPILYNLQDDYLSKSYKFYYTIVLLIIVSLGYSILIYPIRPGLTTPEQEILNLAPAYLGMMTALFLLNSYVQRDIISKKKTGKYQWQWTNSDIKRDQGICLLLIIGLLPFILFVNFPIMLIVFKILEFFGLPFEISFFISLIPFFILTGIWVYKIWTISKRIVSKKALLLNY